MLKGDVEERKGMVLLLCILLFGPFFLNVVHSSAVIAEKKYIGADRCRPCHEKEYLEWIASGHSQILHRLSDDEIIAIPVPAGYSRKDISYVIGGYRWKALFLDRKGFIVNSSPAGTTKTQYNLQSRKWVDYLPGSKIAYDCARCHATGYSPEGHQDNLEGIIGTWKFPGVQCEACHGPGSRHAESSLMDDITVDRKRCADCHSIKPLNAIPLKNVFLAEYSETNQLLKSKMKKLVCTDCHSPHLSSERSMKQSCAGCHPDIARIYKESYMYRAGVRCEDCHMPPAEIIAEGDPRNFRADFRSHLFKIVHNEPFPAVVVNGQRTNPGYLSVDYACMRCHALFENRDWAVRFSMFAHRIKVTTDVKIMRLQLVSTYIGFFFAATALLSGLYLKKLLLPSLVLNKRTVLSTHRLFGWTTLSIALFEAVLCIYFHFPLAHPAKILGAGWFLIHPVNGAVGIVLYAGKILNIRKYKKGWALSGLLWGLGVSLFWLIQLGTVILHV